MAVVIRLRRMGHKKAPYYRLVVADSRSPRDGRFIETVGTYQPVAPSELNEQQTVDTERVEYWLSVGAKPTETAWSILKRSGVNKPVKSQKRKAKKSKNCLN